jgi:hypothetical protein
MAIHGVNCYAYFNPSLTPIHYLRFREVREPLCTTSVDFVARASS